MKKLSIPNAKTYNKLKDGDGLTFKNGKTVTYKTGYQVGIIGVTTTNIHEIHGIIKSMNGNAGVWYSKGIYYIDYSIRITTKSEAIRIGKQHNQQEILKWSTMECIKL